MKYPNIEAERARHGYTKHSLAEALGVSTKTYLNWQGYKTEIPCSKIIAMSELFQVSTDYLLGVDHTAS